MAGQQDVQPPVAALDVGDAAAYRGGVGHVEHGVVEAAWVGELVRPAARGSFERGGADVGDDDSRARRGEPHRRLTAEAAGAAGDQGDLAVKATKPVGHLVPPRSQRQRAR